MKLKFTKMQGCGNDFIFIDCFPQASDYAHSINDTETLSRRLCDRNFGIGGDGVVLLLPPDNTANDARMRIFNADGSEAKMCGNATRCIGKYLYEHGYIKSGTARLETNSGVKILKIYPEDVNAENSGVKSVRVDMGNVELSELNGGSVVGRETALECGTHKITLVSVGNPHCVLFASPELVTELGPSIERDKLFPERINVEFAEVTGYNALRMRVWERGSGETLACGTGACATAVAAVENGLCDRARPITVELRGGTLIIEYTPETVFMTGPAEIVFEGEINL